MTWRFLVALFPAVRASVQAPNVSLDDGTIVMGGVHAEGTVSYWGIRYGEVPRRFEASRRWHPEKGTIVDGSKENTAMCWQNVESLDIPQRTQGTEDCLFLDLNTPAKRSQHGAAVMFFIHGGGLVTGAKPVGKSNFLNFVTEGGVVTISINYRLNVMGFFTNSGSPANNGIRDQILALHWTNANVARFGGNARRITVFGQSAGGLSTTLLTISPLARGLFQQAIAQSPMWQDAAQFKRPIADAEASIGANCMKQAGCDSFECMQERPKEAFKTCHFQSGIYFVGKIGQIFTGWDGEVIDRSLFDTLCAGNTNAVDIVVGTLPFEWRLFQGAALAFASFNQTKIDATFPEPETGIFPMSGAIHKFLLEYAEHYAQSDATKQLCVRQKLLDMYKGADKYNTCPKCAQFNTSGMVAEMQLTGDIEGTLGTQLLAQSSGGRRFRYLFDNGGDSSDYGATHAADCNYFCSQPGDCDGSGINTPEKSALGMELRKRWTTFAKTGVPATGWPEVDKKKGSLAVPMLNIDMKGQTVRHSAWFSNAAAELLADLACGRKGVKDLDCDGTLISV